MKAIEFARTLAWALLVAGSVGLTIGCGETPSADFKAYGDLDRQQPDQRDTNQAGSETVSNDNPRVTTVRSGAADPANPSTKPVVEEPVVAVKPAAAANSLQQPAREIKLLIKDRSFKTEGPEGALRLTYDDTNLLQILNMDPVPADAADHLPKWMTDLVGKRIRIRGFMFPSFQETGLRVFVLVRDNQECCFGPKAKIYDHVLVRMRKGQTTDYIQGRPFDVAGIFRIEPSADDGQLYEFYRLDDAIVITR